MSKLDRKTQKIFADALPADDNIAIFGSLADEFAASPPEGENSGNDVEKEMYSKDPDKIQNDAYGKGWAEAVVPDDSPALEDMNALFYLVTRQLAYVYQNGVPEWDAGTTYCIGSICSQSGVLYVSLADDNTNNAVSNAAKWKRLDKDITDAIALKEDRANKKQLVNSASQTDFPSSAAVAAHVAAQIASALSTAFVREFPDITGIGVQVAATPTLPGAEGNTCFTLSWDTTATQWIIAYWTFSGGAWLPVETTPARDLHWVAVQSGDEINGYYVMGVTDSQGSQPQWELLGPDISDIYTKGETDTLLAVKADGAALAATDAKADQALGTAGDALGDANAAQQTADLATDAANAAQNTANSALQALAGLATVATSGAYDDLTGKPAIPPAQVNADWNASAGVAQILNKPAIPPAYTLPPATAGALGGVKVGAGLAVTGDGTLSATGGGGGEVVKSANTYFIDDKFGSDSTAEAENAGRPFKTMEAALSQIVELPPDTILVDLAPTATTISGITNAGRKFFLVHSTPTRIVATAPGTFDFTSVLTLPTANEILGFDGESAYFQKASSDYSGNNFVVNGVTLTKSVYKINIDDNFSPDDSVLDALFNNPDAPPPMILRSAGIYSIPPGCHRFQNGCWLYPGNIGGGLHQVWWNPATGATIDLGTYNSSGNKGQLRFQGVLNKKAITGKDNGIFHQDGKAWSFSGLYTVGNAICTEDFLIPDSEYAQNTKVIPIAVLDAAPGAGPLGPLDTSSFPDIALAGSYLLPSTNNTAYSPTNPITKYEFSYSAGSGVAVKQTTLPGAVPATINCALLGEAGIYYQNGTWYPFPGSDLGVEEVVLDVGARNKVWEPATPVTSGGKVLQFWPRRITIQGRGRTKTKVDLSAFVDAINIQGNDSWLLSYNNPSAPADKATEVRGAYIDSFSAFDVVLSDCRCIGYIDISGVGFSSNVVDRCVISKLLANQGAVTDCTIGRLELVNASNANGLFFVSCSIDTVVFAPESAYGAVFKGCHIRKVESTIGVNWSLFSFGGCFLNSGFYNILSSEGVDVSTCFPIY